MELFCKLIFINFLQELIGDDLIKNKIISLQAIILLIQANFSLYYVLHDSLRRILKLVTETSFPPKQPRT